MARVPTLSAFDGSATDVTIEYLTIEDFASSGSGQMVVNHDGAAGWTVRYDTVQDNLGAGVGIGSDNVITHNCLAANNEYGFSSFGGSRDVTLTGNDISDNDTHGTYDQAAYTTSYSVTDDVATVTIRAPMDLLVGSRIVVGDVGACTDSWCANLSYTALDGTWTIASVTSATSFTFDVATANVPYTKDTTGTVADPQVTCGCSGGGKFWNTLGATVTGNWVHDNGNVGIWVDTDNTGFDISGNYFDHNWAEAVIYEISYNASIANNAFVDNVLGGGPSPGVGGFPDAALYISESGSDSRVAGPYGATFDVTGNDFTDNWGGVVIYENSNRACGITNDTYCTLVAPATYTLSTCAANIPNGSTGDTPDYVDNCRWKSQHVDVTHNTFNFTPRLIGPYCTTANTCGFNGLFSEGGTTPSATYDETWPNRAAYPYAGYTVSNDISNHQHNTFAHNAYCASGAVWRFVGFAQGNSMTRSQWKRGEKNAAGSRDRFDPQDAHSTFKSGGCPQ